MSLKLNIILNLKNHRKWAIQIGYLLHTEVPAAVVVAPSSAVSVAKLRPHHILWSLTIPAAAMAALVPPMI